MLTWNLEYMWQCVVDLAVCNWPPDRPQEWVSVNALMNLFCRGESYHKFCFTICILLIFIMYICWAIYWIYENGRCEQHKIRKYSTSKSGLQIKNTKANWINTYHELCFVMCNVLDFIECIFSSLYWIYVNL
jgi:hypothetical protein